MPNADSYILQEQEEKQHQQQQLHQQEPSQYYQQPPQPQFQFPGQDQKVPLEHQPSQLPFNQMTEQPVSLLCSLCNNMVQPEFQTVLKYNSNANVAGVIFGFICPCFVLNCCGPIIGGKAEEVPVRLCPHCKVPI